MIVQQSYNAFKLLALYGWEVERRLNISRGIPLQLSINLMFTNYISFIKIWNVYNINGLYTRIGQLKSIILIFIQCLQQILRWEIFDWVHFHSISVSCFSINSHRQQNNIILNDSFREYKHEFYWVLRGLQLLDSKFA